VCGQRTALVSQRSQSSRNVWRNLTARVGQRSPRIVGSASP
jgi:hypothetical protein